LLDEKGEELILLKSTDAKLMLAEGHYVVASGLVEKLPNSNKNILLISSLVLPSQSNGTN
jgi:hypothetical protein